MPRGVEALTPKGRKVRLEAPGRHSFQMVSDQSMPLAFLDPELELRARAVLKALRKLRQHPPNLILKRCCKAWDSSGRLPS